MTKKKTTKNLDIAQQIAVAVRKTSAPTKDPVGMIEFDPENDFLIGEVPHHLRHLHNLMSDLGDKNHETIKDVFKTAKRAPMMHSLFYDALEQHFSVNYEKYNSIKICSGWRVAGYN